MLVSTTVYLYNQEYVKPMLIPNWTLDRSFHKQYILEFKSYVFSLCILEPVYILYWITIKIELCHHNFFGLSYTILENV